jgi:primosomal protein N' (replication factor Y)
VTIARVALDVPLPQLFDYRLPLLERDPIGCRVVVPFARSTRIGVIVECGAPRTAEERIKPVSRVFWAEPALPADVLELARFASRYYRYPLGPIVIGALPGALRRVRGEAGTRGRWLRLTPAGEGLLSVDVLPARAVARRRVLSHFLEHGAADWSALRALTTSAGRAVAELIRAGWVEQAQPPPRPPLQPPQRAARLPSARALTAAQLEAAGSVTRALGTFTPFLLYGVTGSGKTEVYFHAIDALLASGAQALVLVPEINLTPQLVQRFGARFPGLRVAALHSGLAEGDRLRAWQAAQSGEAEVVIGTRLAVFTPLPRLGLIVVDEEHDASYKQQEGLRYSARDLAVMRAKLRRVPALLGSATPSLESFAQARAGSYRLLTLAARAMTAPPAVRCVDTRGQRLRDGLSVQVMEQIDRRLQRGEQSLVFVNRRGFAPALTCSACGWAAPCPRCTARLVVHLGEQRLRCHYCGHQERIAIRCAACGNQDLAPAGHGTQRIESSLVDAFRSARVLRVDRDSTRRRAAFAGMQERILRSEVDILVGTQMLAKGHDFPRLTLVSVVNTDSALYSADFRATERLYALLTQVGGRAGRGEVPGEVLIQTAFPQHPLFDAVQRLDYPGFASALLEERRAARFPPFAYQALLRAEAHRRETVSAFLDAAAGAAAVGEGVEVFDPVPAPVPRVAGKERGHLLVQSTSRARLQRFLDSWHAALEEIDARHVRWALDVDPLEF